MWDGAQFSKELNTKRSKYRAALDGAEFRGVEKGMAPSTQSHITIRLFLLEERKKLEKQ